MSMSTEIQPHKDKTFYALADELSVYFETREMVMAALAEPQEPTEAEALKIQLAEIDTTLAKLGAEIAAKADNIAGVLRRMDTEQEQLKAEQERIHARRKTFERAEKWLRDYTVSVMRANGMDKLKTTGNTLYLRQTDAVVVTDGEAIPEAYKNVSVKMPAWLWRFICDSVQRSSPEAAKEVEGLRVTQEISLVAIKKAIKSGVTVEGADVEFSECLVLR